MPLILSPDQRSIAAPNSPKDPNGIAHGIDPSDVGDGVATKAARALAKANWAEHLVSWRLSQLLNSVAVPLTWAELNFTGGADTDFNVITAVAGGATPVATLTNVLANDTAATSVLTINGISIPPGETVTIMTGATSYITVGSDGAATYTSNGEYATLFSGSNVAKTFTYTNNAGNGGKITVVIYGSLSLGYSLDIFDNGSFGVSDLPNGVLTPGVDTATLSGDFGALVMQVEGDAVTRYAGDIGNAYLTFGSDDDRLKYTYQDAPLIDNVGFVLRLNVPTGVSGRIVETIATTGGYKIEIIGSNIRATVSDGVTELVVERLMTFDEPVTMASAISDNGLLLSLSGDTDLTLSRTDRSIYVPNESTIMYIGGGGAEIYGGELYSPAEFTASGLVTLMDSITTLYLNAVDPTIGMTLDATWNNTYNTTYSNLNQTSKFTAKIFVTRTASDFGVLLKSGADISGLYAIIWDDGSATGQLMMLMGAPNGSFASSADTAVVTCPAPTGSFEVVISGDSLSGKKAALYVNNALIGVDGVDYITLAGGRKGAINRVYDQMASNPPGWEIDNAGLTTMVSSALIYVDEATADVA
jgi:hypothetical protein